MVAREEKRKELILTKQVLLLPEQGYLFMLNSKCASSSIRRMALFKLGYADRKENTLPYIRQFSKVGYCQLPKWYVVVRNPYDRIASLWFDKTQRSLYKGFRKLGMSRGMPFIDFVKIICTPVRWRDLNSHLWPQTIVACHFWDRLKVIRIEDLPGVWPKDLPPLDKENAAKKRIDYDALWTDELREMIVDRYRKDFELLWPAQIKK